MVNSIIDPGVHQLANVLISTLCISNGYCFMIYNLMWQLFFSLLDCERICKLANLLLKQTISFDMLALSLFLIGFGYCPNLSLSLFSSNALLLLADVGIKKLILVS